MPLMARVCATSPCAISQSAGRSFENAVPLGNVKTGAFRKTASSTCASLGEWSNPEEVPATVKKRFGHVGPGIAANQLSQTPNWVARKFSTGSWSGVKTLNAPAPESPWSSCGGAKPVADGSATNGG